MLFTSAMERELKARAREVEIERALAAIEAQRPMCKCGKHRAREVYGWRCEDCWVEAASPKMRTAKAKAMRDVIPSMSVGLRVK
jgi:hypothetical protein